MYKGKQIKMADLLPLVVKSAEQDSFSAHFNIYEQGK